MIRSSDSFVGQLALESISTISRDERPYYDHAIKYASETCPPPYGMHWFGDEFRRLGRNNTWLANLLVSDSDMEGYSAGRLWQYAQTIQDSATAHGMQVHAKDEAIHSKIFAKMLYLAFPSVKSEELTTQLAGYSPELKKFIDPSIELPPPSYEELLNSMILVNLYEIKALVLGKLLTPLVLAHTPAESRSLVQKMMKRILADEAKHILYSADYIETACREGYGDFVLSAIKEFQGTLNLVTETDLAKDLKYESINIRMGVL